MRPQQDQLLHSRAIKVTRVYVKTTCISIAAAVYEHHHCCCFVSAVNIAASRGFSVSLHHDAHYARARAMVITRIFLLHHRARQQLLLLSAVTHHQHHQQLVLLAVLLMTKLYFMSIIMLKIITCDDARQRSTSIAHHHPTLFVDTIAVVAITGSSAQLAE